MKILITGGCGFMGSNCVRHFYLKYLNYKIFNLDFLTYAGNTDNLLDIEKIEANKDEQSKRYFFTKGDICDKVLLDQLFSDHNFDLVINFAAETHVDRSIIDVTDFIKTNIGGAYSLIEMVRKHKTPRFIHISTDEIYGDVHQGKSNEDAPLRASNPYASSKAAADIIVQSFIRTHRVPAIIVRGSNNYGPYQYPEKLIPLVVSNLIEGKKVPLHGNGRHIRSWLYVEDFCNAIDIVAHKSNDYSIYNVAGEEKTNLEVIRAVANKLDLPIDRHIEYVNDRPGADMRYAPDPTKLQKELGWERGHTLGEKINEIVDWFIDNRWWWEKIKKRKEYSNHYEKQSKGQWY